MHKPRAPVYQRFLETYQNTTLELPEANKLTSLFARGAFRELIEDMEVALLLNLSHNSPLLEQIICYLCPNWFSMIVEHNLEVFALTEQRWVNQSLQRYNCREMNTYMPTRIVIS